MMQYCPSTHLRTVLTKQLTNEQTNLHTWVRLWVMIQYLRLHICAVASLQNLFALHCSAKEMKWLVLIYQLDKYGVTWMLSLPLIKIWTTLLLRRRLMGKTASSARINRAFHLLVFPCSCVFKFEPVREPASICCKENLGFHPILKTDWQIQTDLIQCQELLAAFWCCHPT